MQRDAQGQQISGSEIFHEMAQRTVKVLQSLWWPQHVLQCAAEGDVQGSPSASSRELG